MRSIPLLDTRSVAVLATLLLLLACLAQSSQATPIGVRATVTILPDGWTDVRIDFALTGNESELVVRIIGDPSGLMVLGDGLLLNYTMEGKQLKVEPAGSRNVSIAYQTASLTSKKGAVWNLSLDLEVDAVTVLLPKDSTILGMSRVPTSIGLRDGWLTVSFDAGRVWVAYKLGRLVPPGATSMSANQVKSEEYREESGGSDSAGNVDQERVPDSEGANGTITSAQISPETMDGGDRATVSSQPQGSGYSAWPSMWWLAIIGLALVIPILFVRRSRSKIDVQDELEGKIIEFLRERGGEVYQSEIFRALEEPRATVWRRIRRMEREGKVKLTKKGKFTVVSLVD